MYSEKFKQWFSLIQKENTNLRKGQRYMSALAKVDLPLYQQITGSKYDCFYTDVDCDSLIDFVKDHWEKEYLYQENSLIWEQKNRKELHN